MSIIIVAFPGAPKPTPEAIKAETELNQKISELIKGCYCYGWRNQNIILMFIVCLCVCVCVVL